MENPSIENDRIMAAKVPCNFIGTFARLGMR